MIHTWEKILIGATASLSKIFSEKDVILFADLSGDNNPLHIDEVFSQANRFGKRIVHGAFTTGLISAVLGTSLPGPGTIYLRQTFAFLRPVFIGDECVAHVEVVDKCTKPKSVVLKAWCVNQNGDCVLEGQVEVVPPKEQYSAYPQTA